MSADFICTVLECESTPDWEAARKHVLSMSERELAIALDTDFSEDDADYESEDSFILSVKDEVGSDDLHKLFLQAVDECESMWCCNSNGTSIKLKNSTVLVCGGTSWGDEPDGFVEIQRFEKCGAAKAAGFWV